MSEENKDVKKEAPKVDVDAIIKERDSLAKEKAEYEKKLQSVQTEQEKAQQKALEEQNKYKELYESLKPKAERHDTLESVMSEYYEAELKEVPEDKRDLIPEGSIENRLKWIKQAKGKGLFSTEAKAPVASVNKKPNADPTQAEYLSWDVNDPRLLKLNASESRAYIAKRQAARQGVTAWGRS